MRAFLECSPASQQVFVLCIEKIEMKSTTFMPSMIVYIIAVVSRDFHR